MTNEERFTAMLLAMAGEAELMQMMDEQEAHDPQDWGLEDDDDTDKEQGQ